MSSITTSLLHGESPIDEIEFEWEAPPTAPESFDCRINWPDLMVGITNQLNCGACWAFTAATAAADRFAIAGVTREVLSPQELLSCDKKSSGCLGGNSKNAHTYMVRPGITTQSCIPFVSGEGRVPICPTRCSNGSKIERFRFASMASYTKNNVMDAVVSDGFLSSLSRHRSTSIFSRPAQSISHSTCTQISKHTNLECINGLLILQTQVGTLRSFWDGELKTTFHSGCARTAGGPAGEKTDTFG
ncbi:putative cathepsin B6 cysteine protease [Blattamonas nauphoetae]|uniref:Cathepsin B6 cysteine protease n=1 Tax=Blattamonas nauphoetae TaxID=2049346 RepID=A0ABQ9XGD7_9EUKA|nr:putative cathepsin B6 cysteine protease [Blattamonas nauphoetae]